MNFFLSVGIKSRFFLLPNTSPSGEGIEAKHWSTEPMPLKKIRDLTTVILDKIGVPKSIQAQLAGFYSARRLMPTIAHRAKFSTGERLDVGGWASPKSQALAMPQRYSEARMDEQCAMRSEILKMSSEALCNILRQRC